MKIDIAHIQKMLDWLKRKLFLDSIAAKARVRAVKRGQVYLCDFGCGIGSEMQKVRPAVIIQNNPANMNSGNTIVIPITHDNSTLPCIAEFMPLKDMQGNIILDGQANASNMMCVSKARLGDCIGELTSSDMKKVDAAIARTVDLIGYYAKLEKQLDDKTKYISKIKEDRNKAQDELAEIREILGVSENVPLREYAVNLKNAIDN